MDFKEFLNKKIIVVQIKAGNKLNDRQKGNIIGLGLRGVGTKSELVATDSVLGMIKKVQHLLQVSKA